MSASILPSMWFFKIVSALVLGCIIGIAGITVNLHLGPLHAWTVVAGGFVCLAIAFYPRA